MKNKLHLSILILSLMLGLVGCGSSSSDTFGNTSSSVAGSNSASSLDDYYMSVDVEDVLAGFGSNYESGYDNKEDVEYIQEVVDELREDVNTEETTSSQNNTSNNNVLLVDEKLVYKCYTEIETLDFDKSYSELQALMTKYNCIIASEKFSDDEGSYLYSGYSDRYGSYKSGRVDEIVIRIPSANYKAFVSEYGTLGNVTSKTQTVDNITQEYYDTTSQVEGLKAQMERLEIMLAQATEIEDMITINQAITQLQNEINKLTTYIRTMDSDVAYSYVTMSLREVLEYSEVEQPVKKNTFIDRLKNQCVDTWKGFLNFLENLLFAIISLIPAIVIIGIIVIIIKLTCKNKIKTWKENRKLRKASGGNSISELNTLLKYDENKVNSEVDTDESKNNQ